MYSLKIRKTNWIPCLPGEHFFGQPDFRKQTFFLLGLMKICGRLILHAPVVRSPIMQHWKMKHHMSFRKQYGIRKIEEQIKIVSFFQRACFVRFCTRANVPPYIKVRQRNMCVVHVRKGGVRQSRSLFFIYIFTMYC